MITTLRLWHLDDQAFMDKLNGFHGYLVAGCLLCRTFDLVDPDILGMPAEDRLALLVQQHYGARYADRGDRSGY